MTLTLFGLTWRAHSPSLLTMTDEPVALIYGGDGFWHVTVRGMIGRQQWQRRDDAARMIAHTFGVAA